MAVLPWLRAIVFSYTSVLALVIIGICAHIESLVAGRQDVYSSFAAFGLVAGSITVVSLPLFLILGRMRRGAFTSMILFEIVWFFVLWVLWVGTAGDTVASKAYYYPDGCIYTDYPATNQICYEITVVEAAAFIIFFSVFIYYDTIVLFAIIQAFRGKGVWTSSIAAASEDTAPPPNTVVVMGQYAAAPGPQAPYQANGGYPQGTPPQPYHAYPGQPPNPQYPTQPLNLQYLGQPPNPQYPGQPPNPQYPGQPPNQQYPGQPSNPQYPGQPPNPQYTGQPPNPQYTAPESAIS
ncbi:hypothetical protein K503DRAFT_804440 [Rhizopogon vinicolor AM-OR11-026]|uniref:MARVEL domain-containing protein n=1 Tax=Rhizopogon vinicolor AM-OR11-026 TaxID=1314800 RepID=A0A1B7ML74_9AGAM|nr:hypothetical protein K503DRAFT_804440 [Rhizopogon vinicolor AM-OR11-026]